MAKKPVSKSYTTKEWKEKRATRVAGKVCEMCGSPGPMHVHHTYASRTAYREKQNEIVQAMIKQGVDDGSLQAPIVYTVNYTCPHCSLSLKYTTKTKPGIVRCKKCGKVVKPVVSKQQSYYIGKIAFKKFIATNKVVIDQELEAMGLQNPEYLDLATDTVTICQRCHFAVEQGMSLCPKCKKGYMRPPNTECWRCRQKEKK